MAVQSNSAIVCAAGSQSFFGSLEFEVGSRVRVDIMARCLIGCGSNQGSRREQLDQAIELVRYMPGVELLVTSRLRETRPIGGPPGQQSFLNSACLIETDLPPHDVLDMLAAVENTLHRERGDRWGPRTMDLDILLYDNLVLDSESLTLPHPRMTTRRFVLEPCVEIAPHLEHPLAGCTLQELLDNISQPHLHVSVVGVPGSGAPEVAAAIADATLARLMHAPSPVPPQVFGGIGNPTESQWRRTLIDYARPLHADVWPVDPHGTVTDYWLETLQLAAQDILSPLMRVRFDNDFLQIASGTVVPHVVILLVVTPEVLLERIAFRAGQSGPHTDYFSDLLPAGAVADVSSADTVTSLMRLQSRLISRLRQPGQGIGHPKAAVVLDASDLGQATLDAVAAVEALA